MHPMQYRSRQFASMTSGPVVTFSPDEEGGAGGEEEGQAGEAGAAEGGEEEAGGEAQAGAEGAAEAGAEGGEEVPPKPARVPWQVKRIDKLTAETKQLQEERDRLANEREEDRRRLAAYEALYGKESGGGAAEPPVIAPKKEGGERVYTQAELDAEVNRRANLTGLNHTLDTMYETGKKTFGEDFEKRVKQAGQAFPDLPRRVDLFQAIAKLPNGTDVYHSLAGDLDHMGEVLEMDALDLGMELSRMSQEAANKPRGPAVSRAPAPIEPLEGSGAGSAKGDPMDNYAKDFDKRQAQKRERRGF